MSLPFSQIQPSSEPTSSRLSTTSLLLVAVNAGAATRRLAHTLNVSVDAGNDVINLKTPHPLITEARLVADEDVGRNKTMSAFGDEWLVSHVLQQAGLGQTSTF
jgi:hypothetical protein